MDIITDQMESTDIGGQFTELLDMLCEENRELEMLEPFFAYGLYVTDMAASGWYTFATWRLDTSGSSNKWVPHKEWGSFAEDEEGRVPGSFLCTINNNVDGVGKWDIAAYAQQDELCVLVVTSSPAPFHDNWVPVSQRRG